MDPDYGTDDTYTADDALEDMRRGREAVPEENTLPNDYGPPAEPIDPMRDDDGKTADHPTHDTGLESTEQYNE